MGPNRQQNQKKKVSIIEKYRPARTLLSTLLRTAMYYPLCMEIRFSQSDARKVFLACEKNVHPIRTTNHAFVWQGMNTRQFSRHFCLLYPQLSSLNASGVDSGCLKKTRIFRCRKVFFNFVSAECSYSKVRH